MKLIVGLGNPGRKYQFTRHNIGFMVADKFVKNKLPLAPSLNAWKKEDKFSTEFCKLDNLYVIKPQTYMNLSGAAVTQFARFYKIEPENIWVIHDDIDLPLGKIRIRIGGGSAGHRGIESIIQEIGSDEFVRFRLGIGRGKLETVKHTDWNLPRQQVEKYVVSPFKDSEGGDVKKLVKHAVEAIEQALDKGLDKTMNRFN